MHDPLTRPDDAAPTLGTLHYAEGAAATVPQNLGGLSRRRGHLTDKLVRGWRVLLGPATGAGDGPHSLRAIEAGETVTPVGTVTRSDEQLGVLRFQPVLYTHANLQEYRARRRREEQVGKAVLGLLALAVTVSVGVVLFVHPSAKRDTTLGEERPAPAVAAAQEPQAPGAPAVAPASVAPRHHTIVAGDTTSGVAARYHVKLKALLAANDLTERSTLRIGRQLLIPGTTVLVRQAPAMTPAESRAAQFAQDTRAAATTAAGKPEAAKSAAGKPEAAKSAAGKPEAAKPGADAADRPAPVQRLMRTGYTVRKGDFPEIIARRFGISPETLLFHNRLDKRSILQIGQKLEIPPANGYYHTVRRGETLAKLLKRHDLDEAKFRRFNPTVGATLPAKKTVFIPGKPPAIEEPAPLKARGYRERDNRKRAHRGVFGDLGRALSDSFHWPLSSRAVSSGFGERGRHDWHPGIDIRAGVGTPIRAARDGVVVRAGWEGGYGRMVEISHGGGVTTRYAHASSLAVSAGERVEAGDLIGRVGTSGRTTGPHLHYEVRINGRPVNPRKVH